MAESTELGVHAPVGCCEHGAGVNGFLLFMLTVSSCLTGKPKNISAVYQNNTQVPSPSNSLEQGHPKFFRGSTKIKCPPSLLSVLKEKAYIKKKK